MPLRLLTDAGHNSPALKTTSRNQVTSLVLRDMPLLLSKSLSSELRGQFDGNHANTTSSNALRDQQSCFEAGTSNAENLLDALENRARLAAWVSRRQLIFQLNDALIRVDDTSG